MIHRLHIKPNSGEPIYLQLTEQISRLIAAGELIAGDELPSVRDVAKSLAVNPMTVSKSYQALLAKELVVRPRGQKMRVAEIQQSALEDKLCMLLPLTEQLVEQAKELKIDLEKLQALIQQSWK
ncbi:GntR family transcriptional regulator [Psychromonas sp. psych-6C06]|uniref:GntR family transcriptional regulator n=1 Tax=Psychromonas sp. psych-6C06 TaxID=2058089 RepID=UPI000C34B807|nr:GntR family transcriptional regulator [Psychromonas sp. psych-6C06]PKF60797.1 GntR family transcriptional regulator [Psychromonas sp. psych-6C06]